MKQVLVVAGFFSILMLCAWVLMPQVTVGDKFSKALSQIETLQTAATDFQQKHSRHAESITELEELTQEYYPTYDPWNRPWALNEIDGTLEVRSMGANEQDAEDDIVRHVEGKLRE